MEAVQQYIRKLFQSRRTVHIMFCLVFISFFFVPVFSNKHVSEVLVRASVICLFLLAATYAGRWCCKKWLLKNKLLLFLLNFFFLMVLFAASISLYIYLMGFQKQAEALTLGVPFATLFLALGVFLALSRETLRRQMKETEVADQQKQSELELLRSQLSPHFLFNTLNNLYGLSITQQDKIPFLIVKLSDLLRYSVYDTKQTFVPLNKELAYIHNYIELEKIRMGDRLLLEMDIPDNDVSKILVPPMLIIVFIENAFKHSKNSYNEIIKINMSLKVSESGIIFNIDNTCGEATISNAYLEKESGIGLSNAVRRLELLYPGKHSLIHYKKNDWYHVVLNLNV